MDLLAIEAVNMAYGVLRQSDAYNAVSQKMFKGDKPLDFTGECIVINSLPMTGDQIQTCIIIINIFVPNLNLTVGGKIDNTQPNYPRITALTKLVKPLFVDFDTEDCSIRFEQEYTQRNPEFMEHYNNMRFKFTNINI